MKKSILCFILFLISSAVYSQNLQFFNVDAAAFPNVKANFYAFDASWNQQSPDKSALEIKENGLTRFIVNVTNPTPTAPTVLSSVLVMDVSNSTNQKNSGIAKAAARAWVNALTNDNSECALTTFNHFNYFNQDFTTDKNKLLTAIGKLSSADGTDYNKALIDSMCGGLMVSKIGKYQKVLVLMTDGLSSSKTDVSKIVAEAKLQKCKIYVVTLDMNCPKDLKDIATQSGGQYFENILSESKAVETYHLILKLAQGAEPCSVLWRGVANCDTSDVNVELAWGGLKATNVYPTPANVIHKLNVTPVRVMFGAVEPGTSKDTTIKLAARDYSYTISSIKLKYGSNAFQIKNVTFPLTIPKNTSYSLTIRYTPTDSNLCYGGFEILTDYCSSYFSLNGGFSSKEMKQPTLVLTHPNGGETFYFNSDTLITWDGVVPSDTVTLEYSIDNGLTWNLITNKATKLKYVWKGMPKNTNNKCFIRVYQGTNYFTPDIEWQKSYGGSGDEQSLKIVQTKDGGYIGIGQTNSNDGDVQGQNGDLDYWIVKLNQTGSLEWQKTLGGSSTDIARSIQQTEDGGYFVAGESKSIDGDITNNKGGTDYWVAKLNSFGDLVWQKSLGGRDTDAAFSATQTKDGGYIVAGGSCSRDGDVTGNKGDSDFWVVKLSAAGTIVWEKSYGGTKYDEALDIQQTSDDGFIIAGILCSKDGDADNNKGGIDGWIVKSNSAGTIEWEKNYGGSKIEYIRSIKQTIDGGYIFVGYSSSIDGDISKNNGRYDYWVVKVNSTGVIEWPKIMGGARDDQAISVNQALDGSYIVSGLSNSYDGDVTGNKGFYDAWLLKLNPSGSVIWKKNLGGSSNDMGCGIISTKDGGYIMIGHSQSNDGDLNSNKGGYDIWIVKLSPDGGILQSDQSDKVFSIIEPKVEARDIDLKQCLVGGSKDSIITDFIKNNGLSKLGVDSIYFRGSDAGAFSLVSSLPKYTITSGGIHNAEFRFKPLRVGIHNAEMAIITQSDTVIRTINAEGVKPQIEIQSDIINFGKVNLGTNKDSLQVLTIKNISTKSITITNTKINGPNITDFKTIATVSNFTLKPDETKKIDLRFKPSEIGRTSGILAFYYDGVGSPAEVQLYGEGVMSDSQDLVSPANDTINVPINWKLIWQKNSAYNTYNLQVSKDEKFADITIDTATKLTNYKFTGLDFLHSYYWRVKAINGSEQTNWSPVWEFTTLMDTVNLTSPIDLSKNINIPTTLAWEEGIYKKDYRLQVSEKTNFSSKLMDTLISNINNAEVRNLKCYNEYFWRVRNESGDTLGYWSEIWQFKTRMGDMLLMYPENTQTGLEQVINFKWNPVVGAEYYQLQISKNDQFTDLVYSKDSLTTTVQLVPNLESQMLYYWRVRVWNTETIGTAYWSEVWTFTTGGMGVNDESALIQIIPNPAGDFITITFKPSEGTEIQIYNTLGEKVMAELIHPMTASHRMNITDLPKGVYFVKIGGETAKFVKM